MIESERINRLHTLTGYLLSKYDLLNKSGVSHKCFNIKANDVVYIVNNYKDIILDSNVYISPTTYAYQGYNFDNIEIYAESNYLSVAKKWDSKNRIEANFRLNEVSKIEVDISCNVILSFHFYYLGSKLYDHISFRND